MMSISSSMKRKAEASPPPSTQPAASMMSLPRARPFGSATAPHLVDGSAPPVPKRPKQYDITNWHTNPNNNTNVEAHCRGFAEGMKYAQRVSTGPAGKKVKLVASPPIAITGMLPHPLGKAATTKAWFDECDVNDPALILLSDQAAAIPWAQRSLAQNTVYRHVEWHWKQAARMFAFPVDEAWPPNIKKWATEWSMNPIGLPRPIRQDEHSLLNQDDIDIWLWLRAVVPEHNPKGAFDHALWPIFQQPGRWNTLVGGMSYASVTPDTLRASVTVRWTWQEGSVVTDPEALVAWLGMYAGVTPTQAHFILEPYAHHRAQGCYHSPIAQDAYNRLQARQRPPLPTAGGMPTASSFAPMVRLAARLSYPLGTTVQTPAAAASSAAATTSAGPPVTGACSPLISWMATPSAQPASTHAPMEVDGAAVVAHPGDVGVDTSDIYHDWTDDSPSARSSCPMPSWTHPRAQSCGGGCK